MTQTFRSRDEQVADLAVSIRAWGRSSIEAISPMVQRNIQEAEARGAAEERGKVSMDIDAVIRNVSELPDRTSPNDQPDLLTVTTDELRQILSDAQPANVTVLEARVKELEGENAKLKTRVIDAAEDLLGIETPCMGGDNFAVTICSHFDDCEGEEDDNGWHESATNAYEEIKSAIVNHFRAALKREGGV